MQLLIDIEDNNLADKIIKILNVFKNDGLKIRKQNIENQEKNIKYSDEYIKENWRDMIMTSNSDSNYYKSEQYYEDRGNYLMEKYQ